MIICDDRQTDFSELTNYIPSSISVPDSEMIMSSLTPLTRNGFNNYVIAMENINSYNDDGDDDNDDDYHV